MVLRLSRISIKHLEKSLVVNKVITSFKLGGSVRKEGCGCGGFSSSTGTTAPSILQWT